MIFDPRIVFLLTWLGEIAFQVVDSSFYAFQPMTWAVVTIAMMCFMGGSVLGLVPTVEPDATRDRYAYSDVYVRRFLLSCFILYGFLLGVVAVYLVEALQRLGGVPTSAAALRIMVVDDFLGDRILFRYLRAFYFGVGLALFSLAFARQLGRLLTSCVIAFGLMCAVLTTGRLYLLLFASAGAALLWRQRLVSSRGLALLGAGFLCLFFAMAFLLGKGVDNVSAIGNVIWNVQIYFGSSLACFNNYVSAGVPEITGGATIPDFLRPFLNAMGTSISPKPVILPFAFVPEPCNTYTAMFPYFHDGDVLGVAIFFCLAGVLHQWLYRRYIAYESPIIWFIFAVTLYPLVMMIFEEAYLSSIGFWLLLFALPIAFVVVHRITGGKRRQTVGKLKLDVQHR